MSTESSEDAPRGASAHPAWPQGTTGGPSATVVAALLQEGLLTRLDDKLDELEAKGQLTVKQLQEEEYVPIPAENSGSGAAAAGSSSAAASSSDATAASASSGGARRRRGQPLAGAVRDLTWQWSEGFAALAQEGEPSCMFIVAQMALAPKGYGRVKPHREKGLFWLFRAIEAGDLEARAYARRAYRQDLLRWLATKDLDEAAAAKLKADEQALEQAMQACSIKEDQVEQDEKRIAAERAAEFGE